MSTPKVALLSAYTKDEALARFAAGLVARRWEILASSGTKKFLDGNNVPSTDIATIVGPPILGHRVVTLAREVHAGILADLKNPEHLAELGHLGIRPISLVYVSFYPLEEELEKLHRGETTEEAALEKVDIGGPTMIRAAAKGGRLVLTSHYHFREVMGYIDANPDNPLTDQLATNRLAWLAENSVRAYVDLSLRFYRDRPMHHPEQV